jgi:hypothetical protein
MISQITSTSVPNRIVASSAGPDAVRRGHGVAGGDLIGT